MCTVTYIPVGRSEFVLTSSRDEHVIRLPALEPRIYQVYESRVAFPKDCQSQGTWIVTDEGIFTLCLLNGAFNKHERRPFYRQSRGLVLLDFFKYNHIENFLHNYNFTDIEPFTLLLFETKKETRLIEAKWDGEVIHSKPLSSDKPGIWSSATLFSSEVISSREKWFSEFLDEHKKDAAENILHFHEFGGGHGDSNSVMMNRDNMVKTVSITSIKRYTTNSVIAYKDVITGRNFDMQF